MDVPPERIPLDVEFEIYASSTPMANMDYMSFLAAVGQQPTPTDH